MIHTHTNRLCYAAVIYNLQNHSRLRVKGLFLTHTTSSLLVVWGSLSHYTHSRTQARDHSPTGIFLVSLHRKAVNLHWLKRSGINTSFLFTFHWPKPVTCIYLTPGDLESRKLEMYSKESL